MWLKKKEITYSTRSGETLSVLHYHDNKFCSGMTINQIDLDNKLFVQDEEMQTLTLDWRNLFFWSVINLIEDHKGSPVSNGWAVMIDMCICN